jgi:hypothetical protein
LEITRGKIKRAQRLVVYGPEGIGKSTLASLLPNPVFTDVEHGTAALNVARTPTPASAEMCRKIVLDLQHDPQGFLTYVVDTADWTERLFAAETCSLLNISALGGQEDFGHSYNKLEELFAKWLDSLTQLSLSRGIHIVLLAHSKIRKFEQPEEMGAYDRWETKLQKKTAALLKEWPDMLLFLSYKTLVRTEGKSKTKKGVGGNRVIRTTHHPCWDAKNHHGLPEEIPLGPEHITQLPADLMKIFGPSSPAAAVAPAPAVAPSPAPHAPPQDIQPVASDNVVVASSSIPANLIQLMENDGVSEEEIRMAVAHAGYYTMDTPITNYKPEFIEGSLIAAWPAVLEVINKLKNKKE